jgi:hypothetical protein
MGDRSVCVLLKLNKYQTKNVFMVFSHLKSKSYKFEFQILILLLSVEILNHHFDPESNLYEEFILDQVATDHWDDGLLVDDPHQWIKCYLSNKAMQVIKLLSYTQYSNFYCNKDGGAKHFQLLLYKLGGVYGLGLSLLYSRSSLNRSLRGRAMVG